MRRWFKLIQNVDDLVHDGLLERVDSLEERLSSLRGWLAVLGTLSLCIVLYLIALRMRII